MGFRDGVWRWLLRGLSDVDIDRLERVVKVRRYANGAHNKQLAVKPGQADDNITLNFIGVICQRSVSALFGNGFNLDFQDMGESEQAIWLQSVLDANHEEILFHRAALSGAESGTIYLKIVPTVDDLPRLILLNPEWVRVETDPEDYEKVNKYIVEYAIGETGKRQTTARQDNGLWLVTDEVAENSMGGKYKVVNQVEWPFDFPPILHWQNLPASNDIYGVPDITDDVLALQDRVNFTASNISKIIRNHAHPKAWTTGVPMGVSANRLSWGGDEMLNFPAGATVANLEMQSDLASSERFLLDLRQAMFDITRTVDLDSISDKVGSLTNFGLRVLYQDMLQKTATKRELYGDAIEELCRRLWTISGMEPIPVQVIWPEILPVNEVETMTATEKALALGILSKQTASTNNGYDWEQERERIEAEASMQDNVGAALLRAFNQGR